MAKRRARQAPNSPQKVKTQNPSPGKDGTRIPRWKYDAVRRAILKNVPASRDGVPFRELPRLVRDSLPRASLVDLGSVSWHTTVVKLDLEARGQLERVGTARPQHVRRTKRR